MWKTKNSFATQILREINFGKFRALQKNQTKKKKRKKFHGKSEGDFFFNFPHCVVASSLKNGSIMPNGFTAKVEVDIDFLDLE